eukprot:1445539-Pleurochrysis_carterae.AAC.1
MSECVCVCVREKESARVCVRESAKTRPDETRARMKRARLRVASVCDPMPIVDARVVVASRDPQ